MNITRLHKYALAVALALPVAGAQMSNGGMAGMSMQTGTRHMQVLDKAQGAAFDTNYMSMMIVHHQGAIKMAELELRNGKRADVKAAAQKIIDDQKKEIDELTGLLRRYYGAAPGKFATDVMTADMKPMMDAAGTSMAPMAGMQMNADRAFLQMMIPHHQSAIAMSETALTKAARPEVKRFAQKVIDAQTTEIKQFQDWLDAGY